MEDKARLGRLLVESNLITEEQHRMATDFQRSVGGNLGAIVVKLGFIEDHRLIQFIAKDQGLSVISLDDIVLPHNLVRRLRSSTTTKKAEASMTVAAGLTGVVPCQPGRFMKGSSETPRSLRRAGRTYR